MAANRPIADAVCTINLTGVVAHIPEPSTLSLLGLALVGTAMSRRRRRQVVSAS